jgi:hypothetical protein
LDYLVKFKELQTNQDQFLRQGGLMLRDTGAMGIAPRATEV